MANKKRRVLDSEGTEVVPGCYIRFSYGIPPVLVRARVIERDGQLVALTWGHNPPEAPVRGLKHHVDLFYVDTDVSPDDKDTGGTNA